MERKDFLKNSLGIIGISGIVAAACKKDIAGTGSDTTATTGTGTVGTCTESPTETEGPFPYPSGEANNPLERTDITEDQTGLPLSLILTVTDTGNNCSVVSNARVDIWHCNKDGYYSGYGGQPGINGSQSYVGKTWLRGCQLTDSNGEARFTTIYPGWYSGRATHIHVEVFVNNVMKKTTQMAFPESISNAVYVTSLYAAHGINTTTNAADNIFGGSATDLATEMLTLTGDTTSGYNGTLTIGIVI